MSEERLSYSAGEIDRILRKADEAPPVHPHLIEHLREKFPRPNSGSLDPHEVFADNWWQRGAEQVINYLSTLVKTGDEPSQKQETSYELSRAEAEDHGPDPRRPGTRDRS